MTRRPDFTLASGPAALSPEAAAAFTLPVTYPYDPSFLATFKGLEDDLRSLFGTSGDVIILPGEAIVGLEAAVLGVGGAGRKGLALSSGWYGSWLGRLLARTGTDVIEVAVDHDRTVSPDLVAAAYEEHGPFDVVLLVHGEGACMNDLEGIAAITNAHGSVLVVDAVSTVGGTPVRVDDWGVDVLVTSPHKCLSGPMPVTLMAISERAWEGMASNPDAPRESVLSLLDYRDKWIDGGHFPSSPPVSDVVATAAALRAVLREGLDGSYARHARAARATWAGITAMGLTPWAAEAEFAAPGVTAARVPDHLDAGTVAAHAREVYGVYLVASGTTVRIGHMGETSRGLHPIIGLAALGRSLLDLGHEVDLGAGVAAAMAVLSAEPL